MKNSLLFVLISLLLNTNINAQNGFGDNFNDNKLSCHWVNSIKYDSIFGNLIYYKLTEANNMLQVDANHQNGEYDSFNIKLGSTFDISSNPVLTVKIKSSAPSFILWGSIGDINGYTQNENPIKVTINPGSDFQVYKFDFTDNFGQNWPTVKNLDLRAIKDFGFFVNPGGSGFVGTFYVDDVQLGTGGSQDGVIGNCTVTNLESELIQKTDKILIRILTTLGQEIIPEQANNGLFIYQYNDGSTKKVMKLE